MKLQFILPILSLFSGLIATSQTNHQWNARNLGPGGMSGRVTSIAVDQTNTDIIYIGAASGGVWRSESGGISWQPIFDEAPLQGVGAVSVNAQNPDEIWVGTGEGNPRNSHTSGGGIFKSLDYGKTWQCMGLENTKTIHRIIQHPTNPQIVYVAATGSAWGPHPERGVFKTTNGGKTWKKILFVNDSTGCADLILDPQNPNKLIAAMWQHHRSPYFFTSGGSGSGLYISYNGGDTWTKKTEKNGLPKGPLGRIGLAQSASQPKIVYALVEASPTGLYKSTDGGENFTLQATENIGNRPFYYADIYVDPQNENRIYNLWSMVTRSEDGGKTFETLIGWNKAHPDHHAFYIDPKNPNFLIDGNDGGLAISYDRGANWRFVENLPLGQFYHINVDQKIPYNVYGGLQDNGSWYGPGFNFNQNGIFNNEWQSILFGDGFDVLPHATNPQVAFAMWQGGNLCKVDLITQKTTFIQPVSDSIPLRFNWNSALSADPHHQNGLYFGAQFLFHSTNNGTSWTKISPDLTTNDTTKQQQAKSGGLTIDATQAENYTTIVSIAPSPIEKNVIWVGTDDGNVQLTTNGGSSWNNMNKNMKGFPSGGWVTQIKASTHQAKEAFVVVNNYRQNDYSTYIFHTNNYGKTFTNLGRSLKNGGFALSIFQDPIAPNLLFAGCENGLYYSTNKGNSWIKWTAGFPSVNTTDLAYQKTEDDLVIGTFGRGAYVIDFLAPLRVIAQNAEVLQKDFSILASGHGYQANYGANSGLLFPAQAEFSAPNKSYGAPIAYWLKEKKNSELASKPSRPKLDWNNIHVKIVSPSGDTIRSYSTPADTGIQFIYWNMCRDGVNGPSYSLPKEPHTLPSGAPVITGTYTVVLRYGTHTDSCSVTVKSDPRNPVSVENQRAYQQHYAWADSLNTQLAKATTQLNKMTQQIKVVQQVATLQPDSIQKNISDSCEKMQAQINDLLNQVFLSPNFKGYDHVTIRLSNQVYAVYNYLDAYNYENSSNFNKQYRLAQQKLNDFDSQLNEYTQSHWQPFVEFTSQWVHLNLP